MTFTYEQPTRRQEVATIATSPTGTNLELRRARTGAGMFEWIFGILVTTVIWMLLLYVVIRAAVREGTLAAD